MWTDDNYAGVRCMQVAGITWCNKFNWNFFTSFQHLLEVSHLSVNDLKTKGILINEEWKDTPWHSG